MNLGVPKLMTIRQLAKAGLAPETAIRKLVSEGKIPVVRVGKWNYVDWNTACAILKGELVGMSASSHVTRQP